MTPVRFYFQLAVVLSLGAVLYFHPGTLKFTEPAAILEPNVLGEAANLAMPKTARPAPGRQRKNSLLIEPEVFNRSAGTADGAPKVAGTSGAAPNLFLRGTIDADSVALTREIERADAAESSWILRLKTRDPRAIIALIVCVFVGVYALMAKALRRGPGGRGLTHD